MGLTFTDSGEQVTVRVRHQVLVVTEGIANNGDAVVELTGADLAGTTSVTSKSGDPEAWPELLGLLDREITGFNLHMR
ncbi:alkyl sulfatase C-terminal domain-containing protein [Prauserella flavalba]|uniref:alkyl sulfatase C-terminal domain-containing protein n=1 Tax=Prauserella flavalba TaxID=1477506 RepID=UPI0036E856AA